MQLKEESSIDKGSDLVRLAKIGEISAGIVHEVRNPLTAVKGFLQLLQREQDHPYLTIATEELDRAIDLLQNFLQVAKPDRDEPEVNIHLCNELQSILYLFHDQTYRIEVGVDFRDVQVSIKGRRNQLKKAFFNLIKNAFEAMDTGGKLYVGHRQIGNVVEVSITDTGVGIPEEQIALLGTPFFSTKQDGTGMGLPQVYSTLEEHGARVEVRSRRKEGTTFLIYFPISDTTEGRRALLNIPLESNQTFEHYILANTSEFITLLEQEAENTINTMVAYKVSIRDWDVRSHLQTVTQNMIQLLTESNTLSMLSMAREHGQQWAELELPLFLKLQWFQLFRKTYWDFLRSFYTQTIDQAPLSDRVEPFFEMEYKVNYNIDEYVHNFAASFTEFRNQQLQSHREMIDDLTVPIIALSKGVALLPIVGTLDTYRAKKIQERSLEEVSRLQLRKIFMDLSGVAFMDTAVVQHIFRIVEGFGLMGCHAVITGIRPEVANTMIELGVVFSDKVETKGSLQQALEEYNLQ